MPYPGFERSRHVHRFAASIRAALFSIFYVLRQSDCVELRLSILNHSVFSELLPPATGQRNALHSILFQITSMIPKECGSVEIVVGI